MKVFVTGVNGQLGFDVMRELSARGHEAIGCGRADKKDDNYIMLDICRHDDVFDVISELKPDAVLHCAAWTAVDLAELEENKPQAYDVNANATRYIAEACQEINAKLLYVSTEYVFSGEGDSAWEAECSCFSPLNYYGYTKLEGEKAVCELVEKHFVVRTSWVFGKNGNNFVKTMIKVGKEHDTVRVVNDQIGRPTYTHELARLMVDLIESDKYGSYNATNEGHYISWYDFCCEIYRLYGLPTRVQAVSTEEYGLSTAKRPHNSRLDNSKLLENGFKPLSDWKTALTHYLEEAEL